MNKLLAIYASNFNQYCYNSSQQSDISEISESIQTADYLN
ncbi:hypothetical protein PESP_a0921 [Pseudoalteromonas espejiana DSM 9414]|nr:hypothetical protein PESP_a0921 [Pseudoalteromonas espejiana DSM 9414]